ncbi:MAG TPA: choice-of-anchor B family protein [Gammaproteobacteria bacterium]|nr:choice-of-anchor B family protein [Gammaproteobacteria bacterium]
MRKLFRYVPALLVSTVLTACGGGGGGGAAATSPSLPPPQPTLATGPAACVSGMAAGYSCAGVNLRKRIPFTQMGGTGGNDIWGWRDTTTGKEYALVGMTNGTAFVDVSNPDNPQYLGRLPTATVSSGWRDIKVYRDHAYIVADVAASHGMQVFDLAQLRGVTAATTFSATFLYTFVGDAHNIAINEDTGFAYVVGTATCNGGLHMVDLSSPASPTFAGCHDLSDTHDTQCVVYHGPDVAYVGREICFSSNENHVEIVDVTDKSGTVRLATLVYPGVGFVHQGWLSTDHSHFYVGDELDELAFDVPTRTIVLDVSDLDAPVYRSRYQSTLPSTDHNLYVRGNRIYEGNYASGLRILAIGDAAANDLTEIAHFDTFPASDDPGFDGVWSVYPYLPSGTLIVNDRDNGLFVLTMAATTAFATAQATANERDTIDLEGVATGASASTTWVQTRGTPASISNPNVPSPTITLPSLSTPELLAFDMIVNAGSGPRAIDTVFMRVGAYPEVSSAPVSSPALQQCLNATQGSAEDIGEVVSLTCAGIDDAAGLEQFPALTTLTLSGQSLANAATLANIPALASLDLSAYPSLPCQELDVLEASLDASVSFVAPTTCRAIAVSTLGGNAFDSALDLPRRRVYVSVPARHEIVVASLDSGLIVDRMLMPGEPWGLDLSLDGTRLFAAIRDADAVLEIDLATSTWRSIPLNGTVTHSATHDVVEAQPDRLFVSADSGSSPSRIVQVRLDQGDAVSQVADQRIISDAPKLLASNDGQSLYIGEGFVPGFLYRLNLQDAAAPVMREDTQGSLSLTTKLAIDASGTRLALGSGQVLQTGTFVKTGTIPLGAPTISDAGTHFAINDDPGVIEFFNAQTLVRDYVSPIECNFYGVDLLHGYDGDASFVVIDDSQLCVTLDAPRSAVLNQLPELRFTDLGLENCVRSAAQAQGWTTAADILSLDCSGSTPAIRSLEGIERLTNLMQLNITASRVLNLEWLLNLDDLTTIVAANMPIANLAPLPFMTSLTSVDVSGSVNVSCAALDTLATGGTQVTADECAAPRQVAFGGAGFDLELDEPGNRAFVSVPALNQILEIDLAAFAIARIFVTSGPPLGIDLSQDRATLYAALDNLGSIAYVDVATGVETVIDLISELDDLRTYDIVELAPDRILVSADPNSGGTAFIVEVRRDLGNAAQRVASERVIRAAPEFAVAPDGDTVFVREGFSPASIYKLDATQANLPLIAEDIHGSLSNTEHIQMNPNGTVMIARGGQLISTSTVTVAGQLPAGLSTFSTDGTTALVEDGNFKGVGLYDLLTRLRIGERHWGCTIAERQRLVARSDSRPLILGDDRLCSIEQVAR